GDDVTDAYTRRVEQALHAAVAAGVRGYFVAGNRDFLAGPAFARRSGLQLLAEGSVASVHGQRVLLMHGDSLCTDDVGYQRMRRILRHPITRRLLLALPRHRREQIGRSLRARSAAATGRKDAKIMDVNQGAVER